MSGQMSEKVFKEAAAKEEVEGSLKEVASKSVQGVEESQSVKERAAKEVAEESQSVKERAESKTSVHESTIESKTAVHEEVKETSTVHQGIESESKTSVNDCESKGDSLGEMNVKKFKVNEITTKSEVPLSFPIFTAKAPAVKTENIFLKSGSQKRKEESNFLVFKPAVKEKEIKKIEVNEWKAFGILYYNENGEFISMGEGQVLIKENRFIFIRDSLKTVILNFAIAGDIFKKEEEFLLFKASGRRSKGEDFEIIERSYKVEFRGEKKATAFLKELNKPQV